MSRAKVDVENELKRKLPRGVSLLLAVSGGADSVVLLCAAKKLSRLCKIRLEVAHIDHRFRKSSYKDAKFVKALCSKLDLKFHLKVLGKLPRTENSEAWGRKKRYEFLTATRTKRKLDFIVTAHTASDVAETFLMRLLSNKELTSIEAFDEKRRLIRPLLNVTRQEIEAYAEKERLAFVHDETNDDTAYLRNKIRHKLIPYLAKNYDRRIIETLSKRAQAVSSDQQQLYLRAEGLMAGLGKARFGSKAWLRSLRTLLVQMEEPLRWRAAERLMLNKLGFNLGRDHSERMVSFLIKDTAGIELPGGFKITKKGGGLAFRP